MNRIIKAAAFIVALLPGIAAAQAPQFPQNLPGSTVVGRLGTQTGPSQAIPFSIFYQSILNSICSTNNAFPVYSTSAGGWVCSTAPLANRLYAGPSTGAAAQPTFRALVGADLPAPGASSLGGVYSLTCSTSNWFNTLSTAGAFGCSQPSFSDISGSVAGTQLPNPSATTLGGVKSYAAVTHQWINTISTAGAPASTQPACADISNATSYCSATVGQLPGTTSNDSASSGNIGEYVESVIATGSASSLTSATPKNITSISLTAGDWDVSGIVQYNAAGSANVTYLAAGISTTTGALDQTNGRTASLSMAGNVAGTTPGYGIPFGPLRLSLSSTTTVFMVSSQSFTVGTLAGFGMLRARRVR